jgi:uncharacterized protein YbjT (DUF2867 family)
MRIVVSTPTGNIGSVVADRLLNAGVDVVAIHRNPAKIEGLAARGAETRQGSLDDAAFLTAATVGADALFWVTPLDPTAANLRSSQNDFGMAASTAVQANGIGRVVNISSVGAQHDAGTGPVAGLHDIEEMLDVSEASVLHLRPAFFFENYVVQVQAINAMGGIMMPVSGSTRIPMIATRDVGVVAAEKLLDESWSESRILGLHGPADVSFDEAASAISSAIGRQVPHVAIDEMQARMGLSMMGLSQGVIDSLVELYSAIESGHLDPAEPRADETTTPTSLTNWAAEILAPMFG